MDVEMKIKEPINRVTRKQKLKNYSKHPGSLLLALLTKLAILLTVLALGFILIYILVKGIPNLSTDLFALKYTTENVSMLPAIINTLIITLLSLCIAGPIGIFSAIYLVEYAKKGNKLVGVVRVTAETLTGIPSIVYGLFGILCYNFKMRLFPSSRSADLIHYGASGHYEDNGGSIVSSSEFIPRRKFWTWSRKTAYHI